MTLFHLIIRLEWVIVLNPFEWTLFIAFVFFEIGSYFEYLTDWWKPIQEEENNK